MSLQDKAKCKCAAAKDGKDVAVVAPLDLLDEYWFFSNTLKGRNKLLQKPPLLPKSPSPNIYKELQEEGKVSTPTRFSAGGRRLLRTPSLPPPRVSLEAKEEQEEVEEEEDLNWSSIYEGVLRTNITEGGGRSTLLRAPSMPVPFTGLEEDGQDEETVVTKSSLSKLRYSYSSLEGHCHSHSPLKDRTPRASEERHRPRREIRSFSANHQPLINGGSYYKRAFQEKKWKSSSDLESTEVQGFKDLGFVFDKEELKESLVSVLPGLRGKKPSDESGNSGNVRRPYLSEAWHVQISAPPAIRLVDKRSAAEMKDQIRLWAQAVACNVRQEC